jgi:hypothetical protein
MAALNKWVSGEWLVERTNAKQRRVLHYWLTLLWFTIGTALWIALRDALWFVGFMSLYAIWVTHLAGWAAETPCRIGGHADSGDVDCRAGTATGRR